MVLHVVNDAAWMNPQSFEGKSRKLAAELRVSVQGTLDDLRKKLKEKWKALEQYLHPQSSDKSEVVMHAAGFSNGSSCGEPFSGSVSSDVIGSNPICNSFTPFPLLPMIEDRLVYGWVR
jgi:hypothetical protein